MRFSIAFKDLPFEPAKDQVIYIENTFDEGINNYIKENYALLIKSFSRWELDFVYFPCYFKNLDIKSKVEYYAPYLSSEIELARELKSSILLDFMSNPENRKNIGPSFLFAPFKEGDDWVFEGISFEIPEYNKSILPHFYQRWFPSKHKDLIKELTDNEYINDIAYKIYINIPRETDSGIRFRFSGDFSEPYKKVEEPKKDEKTLNEEEIEKILSDLQATVKSLRLYGVELCAIHDFIDKQEPISPLVITEDLRLFLPQYNNIEIVLSPQKKALYFLFLNHPEGIILQHLDKYHNELVNYYKQTNNGLLTPKMEESITKLETYGNNQINVVITRIREAFYSKFDERLAKNYIICGDKGEPYKIPLNRDLVIWEES